MTDFFKGWSPTPAPTASPFLLFEQPLNYPLILQTVVLVILIFCITSMTMNCIKRTIWLAIVFLLAFSVCIVLVASFNHLTGSHTADTVGNALIFAAESVIAALIYTVKLSFNTVRVLLTRIGDIRLQ